MINRKRSKKLMWIILSIVIILIASVIIFFNIPYSKTRSEFSKVISTMISNEPKSVGVFTKEDINGLPSPVQKYFEYCGYLGTPKMSHMKMIFKNIDFKLSANRSIKIDYTQYNFVDKPERFAYIDSSLYGIPFEGFDSYKNGVGSMKGIIAKTINVFDQRGDSMDKACLVTILGECLAVPNVALQDYIQWEEIDSNNAKGTITYYGIFASGVFTFDNNGLLLSFKTMDRVATGMDGSTREAEWSEKICDYQTVNGVKLPKILQAIWHYPEGDSIYFNENKESAQIEFE